MAEPDGGPANVLKLMTWLSPAFPVGAFAYSHGLEAAVADGRPSNAQEVSDWLEALVSHGSGWNDLVIVAEAYRAALAGDGPRLAEVGDLALALGGSAERRMETRDLGLAFADASRPWDVGGLPSGEALSYPVAVGALAARHGIALTSVLAAYAQALTANLLGACIRLVPLGQREAAAILHRLEPVLAECAGRAAASTTDDLGSATILSDIAAMRHETLVTRLFRS